MRHLVYTTSIQSIGRSLILQIAMIFAALAINSQVKAQCGTTYTVTITTCGFWDESHFEIRNASGAVVYSQTSAGTFTYTASGTAPNHGPFTFFIETQGTYNDNCANWSVSACGMSTISGTITGGLTYTSGGFCGGAPVSPNAAGINTWNVHGYSHSGYNFANLSTFSGQSHVGYYTNSVLDITSTNQWCSGCSPSDASGWAGCVLGADNHTVVYKRQGFPCKVYQIDLNGHDDGVICFVNGTQVYSLDGCCADRGIIWTGVLGPNSTVEFRVMEGGGGSNLTVDFIEIGDLAITSSGAALYSCESPRTLTANYGGGTWSGPGVSGNTFNPSGSVGNQTITYTLEGCAVNQTINVLSQPGNASVFGNNQWNIYGYNSTDLVTNYYGFYTDTRLNVNTQDRWDLGTQSPSNATSGPNGNGWTGCTVPPDNHSYRIRRQGFPCGLYNVQVMHDDNYNVLLNGVSIHSGGCCTNPTGVLSNRFLGTNTTLELTIVEGGGGSYGGFILTKTADLAITSSNANMYSCEATRALTANAAGGVWSGPGVSGSSFNPSGLSGNQTITYTLDGCSVSQTINVVGYGNPATFGSNIWNVYGYNGNDVNLGGGLVYRGYYTEPLLSYSSSNRWTNAPSDASGWLGCSVGADNHTVVSKRTGVPSNGVYSVSVNQHDDNFQFYTGGTNQFESPYCCMVHTDIQTQYMDGTTTLEMRHGEGGGGSNQGLTFTQQNLSATVTKTDKTACNVNNGTITFSSPTGAVSSPVFKSNFSAATGVAVSGSASVTGGILQLTPNAGSQLGGAIFTNSTATNASSLRAEFDFRVFDGSEADGFSFNYGNMAGPPANAGEGGWGTGLCVNFVTYPGAGGPFVRILYGGANISGNVGVAIRNAAFRKCVIFVNTSNQISVSINGVAVITNLALPAAFQSTDKTAWQFSMSGRTGGATDNHWIDNLVINAYNQYEYSLDGTTWNSTGSFTGLALGTYTPRIRNKAFTAYPVSLSNVTISEPSTPTATVGVTNVTCNGGNNGVVSANVTGAATPYTYAWSGGGTGAIKTGCTAGTYTVTVTSATGCSATASGTVAQPAALGLSTVITNASCLGVCDGAVNLTVSGGTPSVKQPNATGLAANLVLWANGDNGVLRDAAAGTLQWSDLSGLGNNITQASAGNRPSFVTNVINGRPVLRFNTSQFMTTAASFSQPYTIFTISKMNNGSDQRLISSADVNWLMGNWGGNQNVMHNNAWLLAPPGPTPDNLTHMYAATSTGATTNFYDFSTLLASGAGGSSAIGRLQLNGWLNGLNEMSDADVAEVIIYNRVLTGTELQGVRNYLAAKYAVAGTVASTYTYNWSNSATTEDVSSLCANTYTVTVTDANGCTASTSPVVPTTTDVTLPTITCPANISVNASAGTCGAVVTYTAPVGTDNCPGATTTRTAGLASGSTFPVGVTTVTHQVTASNGATASCSFTVTVVDNQAPTITCPANISVNASAGTCGAVVTYTAPVGTDNCPGATTTRTAGLASGSTFPVGVTTVTYQVTASNGATANCSFTVTVVDNQAPNITCPANISVNASAGTCGAVVTYTAPVGTDNCPGATTTRTAGLASGSTFPVGVTTVTHQVTASNGATASCSFTVTVVDNQAPTITCPANISVNASAGTCGAVVTYTTPVGTDNCPGATTTRTAGLASGSTFPVGVTTVTHQVTASNGATASCSFTVTVVDNQAPTITCPANISVNASAGTCGAVVTYTAPVGTDNCPGATTTRTAGLASGSTFPVGVTTVTHQVTASNGATASCSFTVTVVDNQAPTITCPANISVNASAGTCGAVVTYTAPVGTDNCPGATTTRTAGLASGSTFPVGVTTVTHQVTASNGATASCSFTVTVVDNQAPNITCPANISVNASAGTCGAVVTYTAPVGTDNCPGATTTRTAGLASGSTFPVGVTTVTYQVTASNGATASCSFTVTVIDNQAPVLGTCPANIVLCSASPVATFSTPTASDNCAGVTVSQIAGLTSGSTFPLGVTTNTFQATDASANVSATCSFTVTVDNPITTLTATASPNPVCSNDILTLTASNTGGTNITWSWSGPAGFSAVTQNTTRSSLNEATHEGVYTVKAINACHPGPGGLTANTASVNIHKDFGFVSSVSVNPNPVCEGSSITLTANFANGTPTDATYSWTGPNSFSSSAASPTRSNMQVADGGSYDVTVSNACYPGGQSNGTIASLQPVINATIAVDECMGTSPTDRYYLLVTGSGGTGTLSYSGTPVISVGNQKVYYEPAGSTVNVTITDQAAPTNCSKTVSVTAPSGHPVNIPLTANVTSSVSVNCYDVDLDRWVTFRDNSNNAILSINDNINGGAVNNNLGLVNVTVYKDAVEPTTYTTGPNCQTFTDFKAMKRHFMISSTNPVTSGEPVGVRLYFTQAEADELKAATLGNNSNAPGLPCTQNDDFSDNTGLTDLFVTKYSGPNEDNLYTNNLSSGTYRVFGTDFGIPGSPDGPLTKAPNQFSSVFSGGPGYHYVQLQVTEFSEFWLHGSYHGAPLPVEMIYFQAEAVNNSYIQLTWATAIEIDNDGFIVERSVDAQTWSNIGWVEGHDNATTQHDYSFNDYNVEPNVRYYYRLKQLDNDGDYEYTTIVSEMISTQSTFAVKDFIPNPTMNNTSLIVSSSEEQVIEVKFYDIIGQVVSSSEHSLHKGGNQITFSLEHLSAGTYTAIVTSNNEVYSKKLVVTR